MSSSEINQREAESELDLSKINLHKPKKAFGTHAFVNLICFLDLVLNMFFVSFAGQASSFETATTASTNSMLQGMDSKELADKNEYPLLDGHAPSYDIIYEDGTMSSIKLDKGTCKPLTVFDSELACSLCRHNFKFSESCGPYTDLVFFNDSYTKCTKENKSFKPKVEILTNSQKSSIAFSIIAFVLHVIIVFLITFGLNSGVYCRGFRLYAPSSARAQFWIIGSSSLTSQFVILTSTPIYALPYSKRVKDAIFSLCVIGLVISTVLVFWTSMNTFSREILVYELMDEIRDSCQEIISKNPQRSNKFSPNFYSWLKLISNKKHIPSDDEEKLRWFVTPEFAEHDKSSKRYKDTAKEIRDKGIIVVEVLLTKDEAFFYCPKPPAKEKIKNSDKAGTA